MKHSEKNLTDLYNNSDIALKQMFLGVNPWAVSLRKGSSPTSPGNTHG